MKSTIAILLLVAAGTSARSLRSETEYPEIKPFDNANSKKFCNYACSSKFYGGEMGWFEVSPIKYAYPGLVAETKKAADVFYKTQKDPVIEACGRPKKDDLQLYNACADVSVDGFENVQFADGYVLQFGIVVPCEKKTIKKLQSSGVTYPVVNGKFIVPVRAYTSNYPKDAPTVKFAVANPDFAPSSNPNKPEGGVRDGFPKVEKSEVCDNCTGPTAKDCDKKKSKEDAICGGKPLQYEDPASPFGKYSCGSA